MNAQPIREIGPDLFQWTMTRIEAESLALVFMAIITDSPQLLSADAIEFVKTVSRKLELEINP